MLGPSICGVRTYPCLRGYEIATMAATSSTDATPYVPEGADLAGLRHASAGCHGCSLYEKAIQTVFGEGDPHARIVLVGEEPGDQEDRQGAPFVGPSGRVLDRALADAGIPRSSTYLTNAVKHFKFTRREGSKRRIHEKPTVGEISACRPWLVAELRLVRPALVVALGATAGRALLGPAFRVTAQRGRPVPMPALADIGRPAALAEPRAGDGRAFVIGTIHPSAVLRADDRDAVYQGLLADLRVAAHLLG